MAVQINWNQLNQRIEQAFDRLNDDLEKDFKKQIETVQWFWPNTTQRRNNTVVDSPRDIVDLGTLRDSQQKNKIDSNTYEHHWSANYAKYVRLGYRTRNGRSMPPRDWIGKTLQTINIQQRFASYL